MSAEDWFARKLAQVGAPAPSRPPAEPYTPATLPQGPAGLQAAPQSPQRSYTPEDLEGMDPEELASLTLPSMEDKHRQLMARIAQAPLKAQGMAARTEKERCPSCGGNNFFSRRNGMSRGPAPSPHCWDCGWPQVQFGSETGAGAGADVVG